MYYEPNIPSNDENRKVSIEKEKRFFYIIGVILVISGEKCWNLEEVKSIEWKGLLLKHTQHWIRLEVNSRFETMIVNAMSIAHVYR